MKPKNSPTFPVPSESTHSTRTRCAVGLFCGFMAALFLSDSLRAGLALALSSSEDTSTWAIFLWNEHWALRTAVALASSLWGGFITGLVARKRGRELACFATLPGVLGWTFASVTGWLGHMPFLESGPFYISIGNTLAATFLPIPMLYAAVKGGRIGERAATKWASYYDSRRGCILGIRWYHCFWFPIYLRTLLVLATPAMLCFFMAVRATLRSGPYQFLSLLPLLIVLALGWTFYLIWRGVSQFYCVLAGCGAWEEHRARTVTILKLVVGYPLAGLLIQTLLGLALAAIAEVGN